MLCVDTQYCELQKKPFRAYNWDDISGASAYADDVTVLVTRPKDFVIIRNAVHCYKQATGAMLNPKKLKALAIGGGRSRQLN
jgi:hypothetical protein